MHPRTIDCYAESQARGNHFEEEFEESEAYLEEAYLQPSTVARGGQLIAVGEGAVGSYVLPPIT